MQCKNCRGGEVVCVWQRWQVTHKAMNVAGVCVMCMQWVGVQVWHGQVQTWGNTESITRYKEMYIINNINE